MEEVLRKQAINGEQFLKLREIDFVRWEATLSEKKRIWRCLTELKNNPEAFFSKLPASELKKMTIEKTFKSQDPIVSVKPQDLNYNMPKLPPKSPAVMSFLPPKDFAMENTSPQSFYDRESYLLPIERTEEIEENFYESDPENLATNNKGYFLEPEHFPAKEIEETYEEIEDKHFFLPKLTKLFSNFKTGDQFSTFSKKKMRNGFERRPLPDLPQEIFANPYEDESSSSGEGVFGKHAILPERTLKIPPTKMHKVGSASSLG